MDISKGEKVTAKAHGGSIDIQGITIAHVDDKVRLQSVETWFDPLEMFRQIAPTGEVTRTIHIPKAGEDISIQLFGDDKEIKEPDGHIAVKKELEGSRITGSGSPRTGVFPPGTSETTLESGTGLVVPTSGPAGHAEMASATPASCPFLAPGASSTPE